jgi:hypothetical protein
MTLLPYGICIIGLLSVIMLGLGLRQLRPSKAAIQQFLGVERIRMLARGLLFGPLAAVVILAGIFIFVFHDLYLIRLSHGAFILGLWVVLTIAFFILALISRLNIRPVIQTLAAPVLAVPLVAYLTPLERFMEVFSTVSPFLPLIVGLLVVGMGYFLILLVRRELI